MKFISHKQLKIDGELISICKKINAKNMDDELWSKSESSDIFESKKYSGGYDPIEQEFFFSYFSEENKEWWFQLPLADIPKIIEGTLKYLDLQEPLNQ